MFRRWGCVLVLTGLLAGCMTGQATRKGAWWERLRPFQGPAGQDVVMLDVALIERPVGDHFLNVDVWGSTDEQVIAVDHKALMEDNGLRIGQVGGITPPGLLGMLTSDRSCVNPRRLQLHAGNATTVPIGPPVPHCQFQVHEEGKERPVAFDEAVCSLEVAPTLTRDGRTRLRFTPQVQYGERVLLPRPAADRSGWEMQEQRPTEKYANLSWEVVLAPNEYVVVGTNFERRETLGHQFFIRPADASPVQRLLVIRTGRNQPGVGSERIPGSPEDEAFRRSPPLAFQAAYTAVRGRSD